MNFRSEPNYAFERTLSKVGACSAPLNASVRLHVQPMGANPVREEVLCWSFD